MVQEAKAIKDKRDVGVRLFRKKPLKAVRLLQSKGVLQEPPGAVAGWLRENLQLIDRDALGELFGMPDPAAVAIMHEYIDQVCRGRRRQKLCYEFIAATVFCFRPVVGFPVRAMHRPVACIAMEFPFRYLVAAGICPTTLCNR